MWNTIYFQHNYGGNIYLFIYNTAYYSNKCQCKCFDPPIEEWSSNDPCIQGWIKCFNNCFVVFLSLFGERQWNAAVRRTEFGVFKKFPCPWSVDLWPLQGGDAGLLWCTWCYIGSDGFVKARRDMDNWRLVWMAQKLKSRVLVLFKVRWHKGLLFRETVALHPSAFGIVFQEDGRHVYSPLKQALCIIMYGKLEIYSMMVLIRHLNDDICTTL